MVAKLLSSPHSVDLDEGYGGDRTPLHVAADAGNREIVALLLAARADVTARWRKGGMQALHLAVCNVDLEMMKLLLDHGAPVDQPFGEARDSDVTALDHSCAIGHMEMVQLLLDRGANIEHQGSLGTALGFAVTSRKPGAVKLLLDKGANAAAHWMARPQHPGDLLYVAMRIRNPPQRPSETRAKWKGQPLGEPRKQLMALLLAYGASKDTTLETIRARLAPLATEAKYTEDEYMATISGMLTEAEDAIPEVLAMYK
ncbi:ankyrin repeat-containing domain protein [Mycena vulgaris]|nr:ankyrin repeat-containing domain protein [Mycena vulgaris]